MPDSSYIQVNEGSDRKVAFIQRAISSNTVEQTEVAVTLPYIPTYVVTTETAVSLATAGSHVLQLLGSTVNRDLLRSVEVTQLGAALNDTPMAWELVRLDTAGTGGTALTPNPLDPVDPATTAAGMTLPTSKGDEDESMGFWTGAVSTDPGWFPGEGACYVLKLVFPEGGNMTSKPPTMAAGGTTGFALKNVTAEPSATVHVRATFEEVFWS